MDPWEFSNVGKPSPRRELQLQGHRPTLLKVCKDSHRVKKPTVAAYGAGPSRTKLRSPPSQHRAPAPVIIYVVSPKVIHTDPGNFMEVVQRLTGGSIATSSPASSEAPSLVVSPSGRSSLGAPGDLSCVSQLATVASSGMPSDVADEAVAAGIGDNVDIMGLFDVGRATAVDRAGNLPRTLTPWPPFDTFFSPTAVDLASLALRNDLSPVFQEGNKSFLQEGPCNSLSNPSPSWDPFSKLL